jgi:hypothetical protein
MGGGALTLSAEEALFPSLDAEIIAVPDAIAVTSPVGATAAMPELELCQVMGRPTIGAPVESLSAAVACAVWPIRTDGGLTVTVTVAIGVGGGGNTPIVAWPEIPSLTALTTALPGATPETKPESVTLAIDALDVNQEMGRPESAAPVASFGIATARVVCPVSSERGTVRETDATRAGALLASTTDVPYEPHAATLKAKPVTARIKVRLNTRPPLLVWVGGSTGVTCDSTC